MISRFSIAQPPVVSTVINWPRFFARTVLPLVIFYCLVAGLLTNQIRGQEHLEIYPVPEELGSEQGIKRFAVTPIWSLKQLTITVDGKPHELQMLGITQQQIETVARKTLEKYGIARVSADQAGENPSQFGMLNVGLNVASTANGPVAINVTVSVSRYCRLTSENDTLTAATVWLQSGIQAVNSANAGNSTLDATAQIVGLFGSEVKKSTKRLNDFERQRR